MVRLFVEMNVTRDEWANKGWVDNRTWGIYGPTGWCLAGFYMIYPNYFALILFNRGFGVFCED